jgi:hypothetical protein
VRGGVGDPERIAVRLRTCDRLGSEHAAGADAVVDDDLLAEPLGQPLSDNAGDGVGAAAGLERHDQADRTFARPALLALRPGHARRQHGGEKHNGVTHDEWVSCISII